MAGRPSVRSCTARKGRCCGQIAAHVLRVEGCLTSSQEKVFGADIQMKVLNTKSARILEVCFLLLLVTCVVGKTLALVGRVGVNHGCVVRGVAVVDAVSRRRQRGGGY